ncbi:unnamed protein product, partial [marine sediment metagenome]
MPIPKVLEISVISNLFTLYDQIKTPLSVYFPMVPSASSGTHIKYDILEYSRIRPTINTRGGPPIYVQAPILKPVEFEAKTWREGIRISPKVLRDIREPGSSTENRGNAEVGRDLKELRLRYSAFLEWMRAAALVGVLE